MRGIYSSTMGMLNSFAEVDRISNNLANSNTVGYKKDHNVFRAILEKEIHVYNKDSFRGDNIGSMEHAVVLDEVFTDFTQGQLVETNNSLDFAIDGRGFFKVLRGNEFYYTRNGEFKRNHEGLLVTNNGDYVLDNNNRQIPVEEVFTVLEDGTIFGTDTSINVVDLENYRKYADNLYTGEEIPAENILVKQNYVENSNVNALNEMVNLINAQRKFEILEKSVGTHDSLYQTIIQTVRS